MCLIMGRFDNTITLKAQLHEQNAWIFLCIRMRDQAIMAEQGRKLHGGFYIVLSSTEELEKNKLLPVALTTSIAYDLH